MEYLEPGTGPIFTLPFKVLRTPATLDVITSMDRSVYYAKVLDPEGSRYSVEDRAGVLALKPKAGIALFDTVFFGDVPLDSVGKQDLTIHNTGTGDLTVSRIEITDSADGMFTMESFTPNTVVAPGDSTVATLFFTPADTSDHIGEATIESDAPGTPAVNVRLTGKGVLDLSGTVMKAEPDHITAHPDSTATITVIPMDTLGRKIDPNFITVRVSTTAGTFSNGQDTLTAIAQLDSTYTAVLYAEPDVEKQATIYAIVSGRAIPDTATVTFVPLALPRLVVSPAPINFGRVRAETSHNRTVGVGNEGEATLIITDIATQTSVFDPKEEEIIVPPSQVRAIAVTFSPSHTGSSVGTLTFTTNDPTRPTVSIPLSGQAGQPEISLSVGTIDFGPVSKGDMRDRTVQISNPGTWPLAVMGLEITAGADVFRVVSPVWPQTVESDSTLKVTIRFTPGDAPTHTGKLEITSDAHGSPTSIVGLLGERTFTFTRIEVTPERDTVLVNGSIPTDLATATFIAEGILPDLSRQDMTAMATWSSTDSAVATVASGVVHGLSPGSVRIIATLGALSDTSTVAVIQSVPVDEHGEAIQGLFGKDNTVGMDDFLLFVDMFGRTTEDLEFEEAYDLDSDRRVGLDDFLLFVASFGRVAVSYGR